MIIGNILSFEVGCTSYKKANKQVLGKINNFTVNKDHSYKNKETGIVTYACRYSILAGI